MNTCVLRLGKVCYCGSCVSTAVKDVVTAVIDINKKREIYRAYLDMYARTEVHTLSSLNPKEEDISMLLARLIAQKDKWERMPPRSWENLLDYLTKQVKGL